MGSLLPWKLITGCFKSNFTVQVEPVAVLGEASTANFFNKKNKIGVNTLGSFKENVRADYVQCRKKMKERK